MNIKDTDDLDLNQLIEFAEAYSSLGDAVQQQVKIAVSGNITQYNTNAAALDLAIDRLGVYSEDLNVALINAKIVWYDLCREENTDDS